MKSWMIFIIALIVGFVGIGILKLQDHPAAEALLIPAMEVKDYSFEKAPSQTINGIVTSFSGEVAWQSRIATEEATVSSLSTIQQGEKIKTGKDGVVNLSFNEFGKLIISSSSEITFAQTLPQNFVFYNRAGQLNIIEKAHQLFLFAQCIY
jgi:hypothetical protein